MSLTLRELAEKLEQEDEVTLIEYLKVTSEMLVERFLDIVEEDFDRLESIYAEEENES